MKRQFAFILSLLISQFSFGQVSFTASSEKVVQAGETFRLVYTINANVSGFEAPPIQHFDVLSGPNRSTSQSFEYINGKSTQSINNSFTYYLRARKEGTFNIPPAKAVVDGKEYKSNPIDVKVIKGEVPPEANTDNPESDPEDLFMRVIINKSNLYEGEALTATVKLYSRVDLLRIDDLNFPKYPGFFIKTIYTPDRINLERETYNGKIYNTAILRRDLLFPQKSGKLTIGKADIDLIVRQVTGKTRNFFGQIVNRYENIQRSVSSVPINIRVKPLPDGMPDDFSGIVGSNFSLKTEIDKKALKTDESSKLKITLSGEGNLHMFNELSPLIPPEIESFPETKDKVQFGVGGAAGSKEFTYLLIPRSPGKYLIPAVNFSYFDTQSKRYRTISTEEIILDVEKGENYDSDNAGRNNPETAEQITNDIRYIKQSSSDFKKPNEQFAGSRLYYGSFLMVLLLFFIIIIWKRKMIRERANMAEYKNRRAAKISRKQLRTTHKLLKENKLDDFYKEIINALWAYTGNKFKVPQSELTKDRISRELKNKGVSEAVASDLINVLNEAEYAQYGGSAQTGNAKKIYKDAAETIQKLENAKTKTGTNKSYIFFSVLLLGALTVNAENFPADSLFNAANQEYANNKFREAEQLYLKITEAGYASPELYYNLGNTCYRRQKYTEAIYYYEKAALHKPSDKDIRHNLDFARLSMHKRIQDSPEMFFKRLYKSVINCCPANQWAHISLLAFAAALGMTMLYLFSQTRRIRILGFTFAALFFVVSIFSFTFSESRKQTETGESFAVIFTEAAPLRSSPDETATILIRISAGHKVEIQEYSGDWAEVKLGNGQVGWLPKDAIKVL